MLQQILGKIYVGVDWIELTHDMAQWRTSLNTIMNLLFP